MYCERTDVLRLSLPEDFIFYPVGNEGGVRRFKITFQSDVTSQHHTMEYYDTNTTHLPKMIISPDSQILYVDSMEVGINSMRSPLALQVNITGEQFDGCATQYKRYLASRSKSASLDHLNHSVNATDYNTTDSPDFDATTVTRVNSTYGYPPDASLPPIGLKTDLIYYYANLLEIDETSTPADFPSNLAPWVEWYLHEFTPEIESHNQRRLAEDPGTISTSFMEFYMSQIEPGHTA